MNTYHVKLTLTQPMLGATPKNRNVYAEYVAGVAALNDEELAEELATVEHIEEKGWTGFHQRDGKPFIYAYVIKGFLKDACGMLRRAPGTRSKKLAAFKKVIDGNIFVKPREIFLCTENCAEASGVIERPLRAQTAQGERVALARSDTVPAGTTIEFSLHVYENVTQALLHEWFAYGEWRGLRQWRNAGYGTFTYELSTA